MRSREELRQHLETQGEVTRGSMTWEEAAHSEGAGLLCERRPSGYANWFAVSQDKVWWVYADSSDGGSWSADGIMVTGYSVPYDRALVRDIYALASFD
ncbi:hypothetical protein APB26_32870 [Pseudomonas aeruginosa]|nr:hypothetical protein APB26_32870 [Pseudomonas aeruginosa]RPV61448.1 hypothetical protein IPC838_19215 [Pseudomonas aeruginosa]